MQIQKNIKGMVFSAMIFFSLFVLNTIKPSFPEIKGLNELFTLKSYAIAIGRALKTKWIQNVYDFAPDGDLAKEVIKVFWHKVSDKEVFQPTQKMPISDITPEVLGKILNYVREIRQNGENNGLRAEIIRLWTHACKSFIDENKSSIINIQKRSKITGEIDFLRKDLLIIEGKKEKIKELKMGSKERNTKIGQLESEEKKITGKIKHKETNLLDLDPEKEVEKNINAIIIKIEKLSKSEDFIPEITESLLWAFFEDKFTECEKKEAIHNLSICLGQLGINIENIENTGKYEEYDAKDYLVFEQELKKIDDSEDKIARIIEDYDRSTNSLIKVAGIKKLPKEVKFPQMRYEYLGSKSELFSTCFEAVILDLLSNFFYEPKEKRYELEIFPKNMRRDELIERVFKNKEKTGLIFPEDINTKFQEFINIISNKSWLEYCFTGEINGEEVKIGLDPTIENLIKILNKFFNLDIEIKYDTGKPEILEITNFASIVEKLGLKKDVKIKDAQDFWNIIFDFVSKKLSTGRKIKFTCKLYNKSKIDIATDKILVSGSYGKINVEILYNNYKYNNFNVDFNLDLLSTHAAFECELRQQYGLINYESDFKDAVIKKMAKQGYDNRLLPIFILLADLEMAEITDPKLQNIFCYCMRLKKDQEKVDFIKLAISNNMIENKNIVDLVSELVEKLPEDENFISYILFKIIEYPMNEKSANKIINKIFEKNIKYENQISKIMEKISSSGNNSLYVDKIKKNLLKSS